jgi:hypothetical protein
MTTIATPIDAISDAVNAAVADLVKVSHWRDSAIVSVPLLFSGGTNVIVKIGLAPSDPKRLGNMMIRVSDYGSAFREVESIGAAASFPRTARKVAADHELGVAKHSIFMDVNEGEIYEAVCAVSVASWQVVKQIYDSLSDEDEGSVVLELREKLERVFGMGHIVSTEVTGASSKKWDVSAVIAANGNEVAFQFVKDAAQSVYRTVTLFSDLARLEKPIRRVSVISDLAQTNPEYVSILSQTGRVIELGAQDMIYRRAAG